MEVELENPLILAQKNAFIESEATDMTWQQNEADIKEVRETLRWHAVIGGGVIAVLIGLITWYIPREIKAGGDLVVSQLRGDINKLAKLQLTKLSAQIEEAKNDRRVQIDPATLIRLGDSIADVATDSSPEIAELAAKTNGQLLNYKSLQNIAAAPRLSNPVPIGSDKLINNYEIGIGFRVFPNLQPGQNPGWLGYFDGVAPAQDSARLESLGQPQHQGSGAQYIVIQLKYETLALDFAYMKNVIIEDTQVEYDGGPTKLENVYFLNCTFIVSPSKITGRDFSSTLLAKTPVTFDLPKG